MSSIYLGLLILVFVCRKVCPCVLPSEWDGLMYDSRKGDVMLNHATSNVESGWSLTSYSSTVTSWTCVEHSGDAYLFRGDQGIDLFGALHTGFLCLNVTQITDKSFYYQIIADEQANAGNERAVVVPAATNVTIASHCSANNTPGAEEFHVILKPGNLTATKQYCADPFLGTFTYSHNTGSAETCGSNSLVDVCEDRTTMNFNYSLCSTEQGFSQEGVLYCVYYTQSGDVYYNLVLNPGTLGAGHQRFTCYAVTSNGGQVFASDNAGSCAKGQSPYNKTTDGSGTLVMQPLVLCPFTTTTTTAESTTQTLTTTDLTGNDTTPSSSVTPSPTLKNSSNSSQTTTIAAAVAVSLLLLLILTAGLLFCLKEDLRRKVFKACKNKIRDEGEKEYQAHNKEREVTNHKLNSDKTSMDKATNGDQSDKCESVLELTKVDNEEPRTEQNDFLLIGSDILIGAPPVNETQGYISDRKEIAIDRENVKFNSTVVLNGENVRSEDDQYSSSFESGSSDDE